MGIVYKAEDTKLDRTVAIKVLPSAALASEDDRARFYREAKAAAQLHHPHIASVFEIDEAVSSDAPHGTEPSPFIAMEFIEGKTLDAKIKEGPFKLEDAVRIASEIASALEAAHKKDIVHRDIKSQNVMLTEEGAAKVLDFGLAQTAQSTKLTRMGSTLGTIAYMSPEQARSEEVDRRTDIWSLGVVLYEMVAGKNPFPGDYEQAAVYSILNEDPEPLTALRTGVPMELERIVEKCLSKKAARRFQHADDLIADLKGLGPNTLSNSSVSRTATVATPVPARRPVWHLVAAVIVTAVVSWIAAITLNDHSSTRVTNLKRLSIEPVHEWYPALHPAGDRIVYTRADFPSVELYYRSTAGGPPQKLVEGERSFENFASFSPDGKEIMFAANQSIFVVDALGGVKRPVAIPKTGSYAFPTWSPEGEAFAYVSDGDSIYTQQMGSQTHDLSVYLPEPHSLSWSPDGRFIAVVSKNRIHATTADNAEPSSIWLMDATDGSLNQVTSDEFLDLSPKWSPNASSLYFISDRQGGSDIYMLRLTGAGKPANQPERLTTGMRLHSIDVSKDGTQIVAGTRISRSNIWAAPLDSEAVLYHESSTQITFGDQFIEGFVLSPDGTQIAYDSDFRGERNTYVMPLSGGTPAQITSGGTADFVNDWSPDGSAISYHTYPGGIRQIRVVNLADFSEEIPSQSSVNERNPTWAGDNNTLIFGREVSGTGGYELVMVHRNENGIWGSPEVIVDRHATGSAKWSKALGKLLYSTARGINTWDPNDRSSSLVLDLVGLFGTRRRGAAVLSEDGATYYVEIFNPTANEIGIFSVPARGGPTRKVLSLRLNTRGRNTPKIRNAQIYYTVRESDNDIWLLDLVER